MNPTPSLSITRATVAPAPYAAPHGSAHAPPTPNQSKAPESPWDAVLGKVHGGLRLCALGAFLTACASHSGTPAPAPAHLAWPAGSYLVTDGAHSLSMLIDGDAVYAGGQDLRCQWVREFAHWRYVGAFDTRAYGRITIDLAPVPNRVRVSVMGAQADCVATLVTGVN